MGSTKRKRETRQWLLDTYGDGQTCPCWLCGAPLSLAEITVDRALPRSRGGTYARKNCRPACSRCNNERGDRIGPELESYAALAKLRKQLTEKEES